MPTALRFRRVAGSAVVNRAGTGESLRQRTDREVGRSLFPVQRRIAPSADDMYVSGVDVVQKATNGNAGALKIRPGLDALNVALDRRRLIGRGEKGEASGIRSAGVRNRLMQVILGSAGHATPGMCHDHNSPDIEQVDGDSERREDVRCHARAGVTQNFRITGRKAEYPERIDAAIHAGEDGELSSSDSQQAGMLEGRGESTVCVQHVSEDVSGGGRSG